MTPEPTIGSISLALTSLRKIFGAYSAYSSGHFAETDQGLRDEILRRVTMLQNHLNTFENQALEAHLVGLQVELCNRLQLVLE